MNVRMCLISLAFGVSIAAPFPVVAQDNSFPGNGMIYNATNERIEFILKGGNSESNIALEPARSISLRKHTNYDLFLPSPIPSQRVVYPIDVRRTFNADDWHGDFFHFFRDGNNSLKLQSGLPPEVILTANQSGKKTDNFIKQKWNRRLNATTGRYVPDNIRANIRRIATQLALRYELVGVGNEADLPGLDVYLADANTIAVRSCHPLSSSTTKFLLSALPKPKFGEKEVIRLCVPPQRVEWSDLERFAATAPNRGVVQKASRLPKRHFLGSYSGVDGSSSGLDRAVRRYQQFLHIKNHPDFRHLDKVHQEIRLDIDFLLCVAQATNLAPEVQQRLERRIDSRIVDHYLLGTLMFFDSTNLDSLNVNNVKAVQRITYGPDGTPIIKTQQYYTVQIAIALEDVHLKFSPEVQRVESRPKGYCIYEEIMREKGGTPKLKQGGKWKKVNPGPNGFEWTNTSYCVRCKNQNNQTIMVEKGYKFKSGRTYLVTANGIVQQ